MTNWIMFVYVIIVKRQQSRPSGDETHKITRVQRVGGLYMGRRCGGGVKGLTEQQAASETEEAETVCRPA